MPCRRQNGSGTSSSTLFIVCLPYTTLRGTGHTAVARCSSPFPRPSLPLHRRISCAGMLTCCPQSPFLQTRATLPRGVPTGCRYLPVISLSCCPVSDPNRIDLRNVRIGFRKADGTTKSARRTSWLSTTRLLCSLAPRAAGDGDNEVVDIQQFPRNILR